MAANMTGRYSTAFVLLTKPFPKGGSPIWAKVGETIESLTVKIWGTIDLFIELLRMTPNLKRLIVMNCATDLDCEKAHKIDFKLEQLSELDFNGALVDLFCQLCHNLRVLIQQRSDVDDVDMMPLIRANYTTLQNLSLADAKMHGDSFREICSFDQLHLKELSLTGSWQDSRIKMESFSTLLNKQSSLEVLKLEPIETATDSFNLQKLYDIKMKLPKLKSLYLIISASLLDDLPTFLRDMPQLECLGVKLRNTCDKVLNLSCITNHNLTSLTIELAKLDTEDLTEFFINTPNIRNLVFNSVSGGIVPSIASLKQLESLEVYWCDGFLSTYYMSKNGGPMFPVLKSVKSIKYHHRDPVPIDSLVTTFPNVENLTIDCFLTDYEVLEIVQELKYLKNLHLPPCKTITKVSLDHIIKHGHAMEGLTIQLKSSDINKLKLTRLEKTVRVRVIEVPYYESRYGDDV